MLVSSRVATFSEKCMFFVCYNMQQKRYILLERNLVVDLFQILWDNVKFKPEWDHANDSTKYTYIKFQGFHMCPLLPGEAWFRGSIKMFSSFKYNALSQDIIGSGLSQFQLKVWMFSKRIFLKGDWKSASPDTWNVVRGFSGKFHFHIINNCRIF